MRIPVIRIVQNLRRNFATRNAKNNKVLRRVTVGVHGPQIKTSSSSNDNFSKTFHCSFWPRFVSSLFSGCILATAIYVTKDCTEKAEEKAKFRHQHYKDSLTKLDSTIADIVQHQLTSVHLLNEVAINACGKSIHGVIANRESFRKYAPKIGIFVASKLTSMNNSWNFRTTIAYPVVLSTSGHMYQSFLKLHQEWHRMKNEEKVCYIDERHLLISRDLEKLPEKFLHSVSPSTMSLIAVVVPIRVAFYASNGIDFAKESLCADVATMLIEYMNDNRTDDRYVPDRSDIEFVIAAILEKVNPTS